MGKMSDEELKQRLLKVKIISRARPNDKERAVRLLKDLDMVVAVTGDGTNDAPALNAANVGLSMGDGTAVAKEASDMTILDNSFSTIANAVMWGRSLYKNIKRFILFLDDSQCGSVSHCRYWSLYWDRVSSYCNADAVGESDYGYLCGTCFGIFAACKIRNERATAFCE